MDIEKIWNESTWTKQARDIILNLNRFHKKAKLLLILRHSQRNEPKKFSTTADLNLTTQGRKVANFFGKSLPENRTIRLFYSGAERCRDTAEEILKGFKEKGGEVVQEGQFKPLSHIGIDLNYFLTENEKYDIIELLYRWIAGVYSPTLWPPLITYSQYAAEMMLEKVEKAPENVLDIHITHDLHLMALRFGWFGLPPDSEWVDYLGGFAFTTSEDHITLLDYGELKTIEYPHWWKR